MGHSRTNSGSVETEATHSCFAVGRAGALHMDPLGTLAPLEDGTACNLSRTQVEFDRAGTRLRQGREFRHHLLSQI